MPDAGRRRYDAIVFDWDGTLVDSTAIIAAAIRDACRDIGQPVPDESTARFVIGLGLHGAASRVAPSLPESDHLLLAAAYRRRYLALESRIGLFDGVPQLLAELADAGYRLAIATGKSRAGLDHALARSGIAGFFHGTRCADEDPPKPHPAMLVSLMSRLSVTPGRTLMIGDTTHDLDLARNAGVAAVAVSYGAHDAAALDARNPLRTVDTVHALRQWLRAAG